MKHRKTASLQTSKLKGILESHDKDKLREYLENANSPLSVLNVYNLMRPPKLLFQSGDRKTLPKLGTPSGAQDLKSFIRANCRNYVQSRQSQLMNFSKRYVVLNIVD